MATSNEHVRKVLDDHPDRLTGWQVARADMARLRAPLVRGRDRSPRRYTFTQGLDYPEIVATSERVAWTVDEIFRGRLFYPSGRIVPASWVPTAALGFLDDQEQMTLNHCRAFSYVHLLGNFEEFLLPHLAGVVQRYAYDDRAHLRALLRFGDEEMKHQQLFQRAESVLETSCGHRFGRYFDERKTVVTNLSKAILAYPPLPRFLLVLALELGTQRHYVESIRAGAEGSDRLYAALLKAHWVEEAQHTKSDMLEIARLAEAMNAEELSAVFDDLRAIGGLVDAAFVGQAEKEIEALARVTGHTFTDAEGTVLRDILHRSLSDNLAGVGLSHPRFKQVACELSADGAAKLGIGIESPVTH